MIADKNDWVSMVIGALLVLVALQVTGTFDVRGKLAALYAGELSTSVPMPTSVPTSIPTARPWVPTPVFAQSAPAVGPVECNSQNAPFRTERIVVADDGMPLGTVAAWSCVSLSDAEAKAAVLEREMKNGQ